MTATAEKPSGPSKADIDKNPGLAPESMIRGENLHKASTDRTEEDVLGSNSVHDLWVVNVGQILVRADDEQAAVGKFTSALGIAFDVRDVSARQARPSDHNA